MSYRPDSLRGHLEKANEMVQKMISKEEYSAHFISGWDIQCPKHRDAANNWIKDQIELYVKTWVLPHIKAALEKARK